MGRPSAGAVLVTGASRGIGRATAVLLGRMGVTVYGTVRSDGDAAQLSEVTNGRVMPLTCDVTDAVSVKAMAQELWRRTGETGLAGLVNNAGIAVAGPLEVLPTEAWREQFEVNVLGVVQVTRALLPLLRLGSGRIVNISSASGLIAIPYLGPYGASKAALDRMSEILRIELRPWGIPVSVIQPGLVDTGAPGRFLEVAEELLGEADGVIRQLYAPYIARMHALARGRVEGGMPPERVAQVIARALLARRPRRVYRIGMEAHALAAVAQWMPGWLREWLVSRALVGSRDGG
jgi:NAD(P)-dependent dehydrogenase (short-subunit alcohol dehydrogenase family)